MIETSLAVVGGIFGRDKPFLSLYFDERTFFSMDDKHQLRVAVMTDSNSGITQAQGKKHGITVLPMPFLIDGTEYFEDISITREEFFRYLQQGADVKTSQPMPEALMQQWDALLEEADQILYVPMSGGLSGSAHTAMMLAQSYDGKVQVVDNHRISCSQKQSVLEAVQLAKLGWDAPSIKAFLEQHAYDASIYIAVDTLKYLKKGGRVTAAGAAIGTVLNIKPVLQIQGEKLDAYAKVRGMKQAQEKMLQAVQEDIENRFSGSTVLIKGAYTCSEEAAQQWKETISQRFPGYLVSLDPLSLSVSCHIGFGSVAIVCMKQQPETGPLVFEL